MNTFETSTKGRHENGHSIRLMLEIMYIHFRKNDTGSGWMIFHRLRPSEVGIYTTYSHSFAPCSFSGAWSLPCLTGTGSDFNTGSTLPPAKSRMNLRNESAEKASPSCSAGMTYLRPPSARQATRTSSSDWPSPSEDSSSASSSASPMANLISASA